MLGIFHHPGGSHQGWQGESLANGGHLRAFANSAAPERTVRVLALLAACFCGISQPSKRDSVRGPIEE